MHHRNHRNRGTEETEAAWHAVQLCQSRRADLLETAEESCDKAERSTGMLDSRLGKSQKRDGEGDERGRTFGYRICETNTRHGREPALSMRR
jgi:hypothetical protein